MEIEQDSNSIFACPADSFEEITAILCEWKKYRRSVYSRPRYLGKKRLVALRLYCPISQRNTEVFSVTTTYIPLDSRILTEPN